MKPIPWTFIPMIDKTSQFFAILTAVGEAKHANAIAMGQDWMFTEMGLGDANGTDPIPDRLQTQLINEWRRAPINQIRVDPANPNTVITEQIIPPEVGGEWIREIGLYDVDGDLVAVANCAPSYKPLLDQGSGKTQVVRMNFIVSSSANIVLKIDPAVVLATREYVDLKIQEELAKLDHKQSARVAATAAITLSNLQTVDNVAVATGDRVLVTAQALAQDNGIYVASADSWTRAADADNSPEVTPGLFIHVEQGTVNGDSLWQLVTDAPINLGTTSLQFDMIAGGSGAGVGTFRSVTVDALGRVVAGTNPTTLAGYGITDALPVDGTAVAATQLETARTLSVSGAASGSVSFDGTANADIAITLADSGVAAGTYSTVSVNAQGLVTGGDQLTGDDLGLGTAAYLDAQSDLHDETPDALMKVGAFGWGGIAYIVSDADIGGLNTATALYYVTDCTGGPDGELYEGWVRVSVITPGQYAFQELYGFNDQTLYRRALIAGVWDEWETVWDTSNFDPALYAALSAPAFVDGIQVSGHANLLNTANVGTDISIGGTAYAAGMLSYGNITANAGLYAGGGCYSGSGVAMFGTDGNSYGPIWGGYLSSWIAANYIAYWNLMSQIAAQPIGGVGTYGMFIVVKNINTGAIPPGTLVEGGYLGWSNAGGENYGAPGGTWMVCGGVSNSSAGNVFSTTICKRVA
jgi:phage-related tail fiber protein